jgi:hypothetical protein
MTDAGSSPNIEMSKKSHSISGHFFKASAIRAAAMPAPPALTLEQTAAMRCAAAFALMWRHVPLFWPLGQMARIPLVLALLERAYLRFLVWRQGRPARKVAA